MPSVQRTPVATLIVSAIATLIAIGIAAAPAAAERTDLERVGTPFTGSVGIRQTSAALMRVESLHPSDRPQQPVLVEDHEGPERDGLGINPKSERVASVPVLPPEMLTGYRRRGALNTEPFSPQAIGPNFRAATLSGFNPTNSFPPDCDGAIGPQQYVVGVNGRIVSFSKTTGAQDGVLNLSTDNFFNSVRNGVSTSDPQVRYDRLSGRWFITIINVSTPNRYLIGVSDAASNGVISPSTVWTFFFFVPATISPSIGNTCLTDYPSLGVDAQALYMGGDEFCPSFQQTDGFVIRKSSVLGSGPIVITTFRSLMSGPSFVGPFAPRGVDNPDPAANEGYFIGVDGNSFGTLDMYRISDPGGTPAISANIPITVPLTSNPLSVPHLGNTGGTNGNLDALDDRVFYAYIRNQQLWVSQNIAVDNTGVVNAVTANNTRNGSRWYQFNVPVGSGAPTIVQSGTVFTATPTNLTTERHYFVPSIIVSGQGHAAMGFTTAGTNERVNSATVGRLSGDPLGTMQTPTLLTGTTFAYNPSGDNGATRGKRRWGDYTIMAVDPLDDMSMWTVSMYTDTTNSYGVRVAKLVAPAPAAPSALADVAPGNPSASVTLTGTSVAGSGFYDPGANLPGVPAYSHLAATVSAGAATGTPPSVVSATYVNPTTVSLVLNTVGATPNLPAQFYTITITNPDGQTSSAAIVHVVDPTIAASAGAGGAIAPSGSVTVTYGTNAPFTITPNACFSVADVLVDGVSVGAVTSYTFNNVQANHTIAASFVPGVTTPVTGLTAAQAKSGNDASGRTAIQLAFTPGAFATSVEVWRKGFGNYPTYAGGSAPAAPGAYPPAGWTLSGVTATGQLDVPPSRDFWYYVAYGKDACGDASPASNVTAGTLDYHLGDVSDGITPGQGDNSVTTLDASLLGAHYGASGAGLAGFEYLDIGPTTDFSADGRPVPDAVLGFEDLVLMAINFAPAVSLPASQPAASGPADNRVALTAPYIVNAGDVIAVRVRLENAGDLQALSVALGWDTAVVTSIDVLPAELTSQGGLALSPGAGRVDLAMLGAGRTLPGRTTLATLRFRALKGGDPRFAFTRLDGRNAANRPVSVNGQIPPNTDAAVTTTDLLPVIPNPSRGTAYVEYTLSVSTPVELEVYSVDGRRVKSLMAGTEDAGRYHLVWNGTDERGSPVRSGLYFVRLHVGSAHVTRLMTLIR
jgi:hypothetical protein